MLQSFLPDAKLRQLLASVRTIAIVGAKDKTGPVDRVGRYFIDKGYTVIPIHPVRKEVWGLETYASLRDVPVPIDLVDVFRAPEYCPEHAVEAAALSPVPRIFWMQLGITSPKAALIAGAAGMTVVEDRCTMIEHQRLFGN